MSQSAHFRYIGIKFHVMIEPRLLAAEVVLTLECPIVISSRDTLSSCCCVPIIENSVFSSFNLSLSFNIHALTAFDTTLHQCYSLSHLTHCLAEKTSTAESHLHNRVQLVGGF